MLEKRLMLDNMSKVKQLVALAAGKSYEITLYEGELTANAKKIDEVFKLDLTKPVRLVADCEMVAELSKQLTPFLHRDGKANTR